MPPYPLILLPFIGKTCYYRNNYLPIKDHRNLSISGPWPQKWLTGFFSFLDIAAASIKVGREAQQAQKGGITEFLW
jgi:hypothetical protein